MCFKPNDKAAMEIFLEYNKTDSLIKHGLAVRGVMRHFAKIYGEDEEKWGVIGLLHDLDYEKYPDEHCVKVIEILRDKDVDEEYIRAIISHGYINCNDVKPIENVEKVLFTIDELTGLITATALMRPSKSVLDLEYKSVLKKYKAPSFAVGVNREIIEKGCEMLGKDLKFVMEETILGMRQVAEELGLNYSNS